MNMTVKILSRISKLCEDRLPPKALLDKALNLARMRLKIGTLALTDAVKLDNEFHDIVSKIAKMSGSKTPVVFNDLMVKAERLGAITPTIGKGF